MAEAGRSSAAYGINLSIMDYTRPLITVLSELWMRPTMSQDQEREEIKDGFSAVLSQSIAALRSAVVAQANSEPIPQDILGTLIALHEEYLALRTRAAVLDGTPSQDRPTWLDSPDTSKILDYNFPQTGVGKALFEALFEIANRLQTLESKPSITRAQLRAWLISKAT